MQYFLNEKTLQVHAFDDGVDVAKYINLDSYLLISNEMFNAYTTTNYNWIIENEEPALRSKFAVQNKDGTWTDGVAEKALFDEQVALVKLINQAKSKLNGTDYLLATDTFSELSEQQQVNLLAYRKELRQIVRGELIIDELPILNLGDVK